MPTVLLQYCIIIAVMLQVQKRRSTLQPNQKIKKNKQTEIFIQLDKCLQIPHDDRLILRKIVKQDNPIIINIFQQFKKDKSLTELQIKLRKFIQTMRYPEKKNYTLCQEKDRNKTNQSQRIYSQNSQPTSYKNSLKCSPEKDDQKKKVINLDITELKKKIDDSTQHNSFLFGEHQKANYRRVNSKKENFVKKEISITKINTYLLHKREKSLKKIDNNLHKYQHQSSKSSLVDKKTHQELTITSNDKKQSDFSKITLRIQERKYIENANKAPKQKNIEVAAQHIPLQDISQNYCYSSNIRNLLNAKLKDQKDPRKNSKILIQEERTALKTQENQYEFENGQQKQAKSTQIKTLIKKPAKPLQKDEYPCSVRLFDQSEISIPMYLNSNSKFVLENEATIETVRDSFKKDNSHVQMRKSFKEAGCGYKKRETQREQQNFGRFFQKIKKIMQNKDF